MPGATALAAVRRRVGGWLRTAVDYVFGYDYFISYGHRDGKNYPSRLWDLLTASGFKVCLDDREFLAGENLDAATTRRVRMSRFLVLVARPRAMESDWVFAEVRQRSLSCR